MDNLTAARRSINMSRIKSRDTQGELVVRYLVYHAGYRYRIAPSYIKGHPDIYVSSRKTAIFVHGCFWHRHSGCRVATVPKTNTEFWLEKFRRNTERDKATTEELLSSGIRVLVIWECSLRKALRDTEALELLRDSIIAFLESDRAEYLEI